MEISISQAESTAYAEAPARRRGRPVGWRARTFTGLHLLSISDFAFVRAVISGLDPITGWERVDARTFRAAVAWDLGAGNQVFRDGKPLPEARWPNRTGDDPFKPDGATAEYELEWDGTTILAVISSPLEQGILAEGAAVAFDFPPTTAHALPAQRG